MTILLSQLRNRLESGEVAGNLHICFELNLVRIITYLKLNQHLWTSIRFLG